MKILKTGNETFVLGEMEEGCLYISPTKYWCSLEGVHNFTISGWNVVHPTGKSRLARFIMVIPFVWRACKLKK